MPMTLRDFNDTQLARLWIRLHSRLGDGGHFGWDWPTLRAVKPGLFRAMDDVRREIRRRMETNGRFLDWAV